MNRKIKFRAWDKACKTMIDDYAEIGGYGELYAKKFHPSSYSDKSVPNLILLQYTGLKDKNGKEIYEGDIVSRFSDTQRSVVKFQDGCFMSTIQLSGRIPETDEILCNDLSVTEVIGNIHQNPELLEATNGTK